jgi:hypothetical protein
VGSWTSHKPIVLRSLLHGYFYERQRSWHRRGAVFVFFWRDWEKLRKTSVIRVDILASSPVELLPNGAEPSRPIVTHAQRCCSLPEETMQRDPAGRSTLVVWCRTVNRDITFTAYVQSFAASVACRTRIFRNQTRASAYNVIRFREVEKKGGLAVPQIKATVSFRMCYMLLLCYASSCVKRIIGFTLSHNIMVLLYNVTDWIEYVNKSVYFIEH